MALPLGVEGPVQAEVFTVFLDSETVWLTGPCGADPWLIETDHSEHPLEVVRRIVERELESVWLVHSTSWRWAAGAVTLSFVVVIGSDGVGNMAKVAIDRAVLARGSAKAAPDQIAFPQVLEHGLRHLAWLALEDEVVRTTLTDDWREVLSGYVPEPFRQLEIGSIE